jgi:hypothetical protein
MKLFCRPPQSREEIFLRSRLIPKNIHQNLVSVSRVSRVQGKMFDEKSRGRKSRVRVPLNGAYKTSPRQNVSIQNVSVTKRLRDRTSPVTKRLRNKSASVSTKKKLLYQKIDEAYYLILTAIDLA